MPEIQFTMVAKSNIINFCFINLEKLSTAVVAFDCIYQAELIFEVKQNHSKLDANR